ncbi:MAG: carbohydrate ABC transporter substrate-binding protein [Lachnospiraceae bacterium]|nr:carbohydrate ABC transporter substrate-binding protein [Lachnospiraceae bacterium]
MKTLRRIVEVAVLFMLLCSIGCSQKEPIVPEDNPEGGYESTVLEMDLKENELIYELRNEKGKIVMGTFLRNQEQGSVEMHLYIMEEETLTEVPYESGKKRCRLFDLDESGNIVLFLEENLSDETKGYTVEYIDDQGNQIKEVDMTPYLKDKVVIKFLTDREDNLYFLLDDLNILIWDKKSELIVKIDEELQAIDMAKDKEGSIVLSILGVEGANIAIIDSTKKKISKRIAIKEEAVFRLASGGVYDFYCYDSEGIYGYSLDQKKTYKLLDWNRSDLNSEILDNICELDSDAFICTTTNTGMPENINGILLLSKRTKKDNRMELKMAGVSIPQLIKTAVTKFNRTNEEYRIEIVDYESYEDALPKINAEMIGGEGFDLLCLNNLPKKQYEEKGLLEDLYLYIDQDSELKREDILPDILRTLETDGRLYEITPGFAVGTAVGRTALTGDEIGISLQRIEEVLSNQQQMRVFFQETREGVISHLCSYLSREGAVFSKEMIKEYLLFAARLSQDAEDRSLAESVKNNQFLLMTGTCMGFEDILTYEHMFGEDSAFVGYPLPDGSGNELHCMGMNIGICSAGNEKEGAWEFLKFLLTEQFQYDTVYPDYFPVQKDAMERALKVVSASEAYVDKTGKEIRPYHCDVTYEDVELSLKPMSEEEKEQFWELLHSLKYEYTYDKQLSSIISEEANAYFMKQKSLEEAVDSMEERVKLYFEEMN